VHNYLFLFFSFFHSAGLKAGTGAVTKYEVGQKVTFQFRVNQHGPGPFKFTLATSNDDFANGVVLKSQIANQVTAGPDSFQGVNVAVTIPNNICTACSVQSMNYSYYYSFLYKN